MTRENKLALVIGFGLLLMAGILVSDHLSAQQRIEEDPLSAMEPSWVAVPDILKPAPDPELNASLTRVVSEPAPPVTPQAPPPPRSEPRELTQGDRIERSRSTIAPRRDTPDAAPRTVVKRHVVRKGETLSGISKRYYGSSGHTGFLARSNGLGNPDNVPVGTSLVIHELGGASSSTTSRNSTRGEMRKTTTVREGETLSEIAQRELGSSQAWPRLWEANKNKLPDPNVLKEGLVLTIPGSSNG